MTDPERITEEPEGTEEHEDLDVSSEEADKIVGGYSRTDDDTDPDNPLIP